MKRIFVLTTTMVAIAISSSFAAEVKISGYVQAQYVNAGTDTKDISNDPFHIRRARIKVDAKDGNSAGCIQIDGAKNNALSLKDAYLEHTLANGIKLRMGQFKLPVSYVVLESSSHRELPERPLVTTNLYKGERDRGITVSGKLGEIDYTIGAFNGNGVDGGNWKDENDKKDIVVRLTGAVAGVKCGASVYSGKAGTGTTQTDKKRSGIELQYNLPAKTELKAEYITGKEGGKNVEGWYLLVVHPLMENLTGAIRYDTYNSDKDTANKATDTIGVALNYQLDKATKVTLAYSNPKEEGTDKKNTETTLRMQFKY